MAEKATAALWSTCDLKIVAFLLYAGHAVKSVAGDRGRVVFQFEESDERKSTVLAFWNKSQRVEPVAFLEAQNRARDMVSQALKA